MKKTTLLKWKNFLLLFSSWIYQLAVLYHIAFFTLSKCSARKLLINHYFFLMHSRWRLSSNHFTCVVCSSSCLDCTPLSDKRNLSNKNKHCALKANSFHFLWRIPYDKSYDSWRALLRHWKCIKRVAFSILQYD